MNHRGHSSAITGRINSRRGSAALWRARGGRWRRMHRARLEKRQRGEGKKKLAKNSRGNVVPPRATLSSRVTGTRRESAYNERALSVCALLFTCLRASRRVVSRRVASHRVSCNRARFPRMRLLSLPLAPSLSLPLSCSFRAIDRAERDVCVRERMCARMVVAWWWLMSANGWVSTRVCPSGRKRPFRGRVQKGVAQGLDAAPCAPFLISN